MKRFLSIALPLAAVVLVAGVAFAQMGGGTMGGGMMGNGMIGGGMMGSGMMGSGMMGGMMGGGAQGGAGEPGDCHGAASAGAEPQLTEEKAREVAQQYASQYLPGFFVEKVEPLTGMHMTMYSANLRGPKDEERVLHINPWGRVMVHGAATPQG